jgi:hypothetical protein
MSTSPCVSCACTSTQPLLRLPCVRVTVASAAMSPLVRRVYVCVHVCVLRVPLQLPLVHHVCLSCITCARVDLASGEGFVPLCSYRTMMLPWQVRTITSLSGDRVACCIVVRAAIQRRCNVALQSRTTRHHVHFARRIGQRSHPFRVPKWKCPVAAGLEVRSGSWSGCAGRYRRARTGFGYEFKVCLPSRTRVVCVRPRKLEMRA